MSWTSTPSTTRWETQFNSKVQDTCHHHHHQFQFRCQRQLHLHSLLPLTEHQLMELHGAAMAALTPSLASAATAGDSRIAPDNLKQNHSCSIVVKFIFIPPHTITYFTLKPSSSSHASFSSRPSLISSRRWGWQLTLFISRKFSSFRQLLLI